MRCQIPAFYVIAPLPKRLQSVRPVRRVAELLGRQASSRAVKLGDRIKIAGGYDTDSLLRRVGELRGTVVSFVHGYEPRIYAAVVRLDSPIAADGITGDVLLMELRYTGASWDGGPPGSQTVGLDLCSQIPSDGQRSCVTLETHAIFEVLHDT
jgi:hypothetical protein